MVSLREKKPDLASSDTMWAVPTFTNSLPPQKGQTDYSRLTKDLRTPPPQHTHTFLLMYMFLSLPPQAQSTVENKEAMGARSALSRVFFENGRGH